MMMNVNGVMDLYQYTGMTRATSKRSDVFSTTLKNTTLDSNLDSYTDYLKSKYGNLSIQSIPRDQKTLERIGKGMSGNDVIIAPNIVEEMAKDSEKAQYYEGKIDNFFENVIPRETARCAAQGLVFEPGGVVVHEDGTVTYICGCSDSPERKAKVEAEHKAKREKEAELRKESMERSQKEAEERRKTEKLNYQRRSVESAVYDRMLNAGEYIFSESQNEIMTAFEAGLTLAKSLNI